MIRYQTIRQRLENHSREVDIACQLFQAWQQRCAQRQAVIESQLDDIESQLLRLEQGLLSCAAVRPATSRPVPGSTVSSTTPHRTTALLAINRL